VTARDRRTALVTGGSRGLGAAIVEAFGRRGLDVAFTYRSRPDLAEAVRAELDPRAEGDVLHCAYDQDRDDAEALMHGIAARWERLDSLVLNAGIWRGGRIDALPEDEWWNVVEVNLRGLYRTTRAALPLLRAGAAGSIVLVSSVVALTGFPGDTAYASAKAGLIGLARSLARELARDGIRVNVLAPGFVESDATADVSPRNRERLLRRTILQRFGDAEEVARAAVFLSEDATYTTGAVLTVDGGYAV
jgi:3-oxoacyl-[acyl-carrier protein] reductase